MNTTLTQRNALPGAEKATKSKLRESLGREFANYFTILWLVRKAEETEDVRYYRVFNRLMEIEAERSGNA